jgi:hypothetical protein
MSILLLYLRTAWNDHFAGTYSTNNNSQLYTSRQTPSDTNLYVSNCLFRSITSSDVDGGAMHCTSVANLLVESTSFFSCKASGYGGAIYFNSINSGQCVLYEVCGYDCCTTTSKNSQFVLIYVYNVVSSKNYVNYSSISRCVNEISPACFNLNLRNGKICCPSINISVNKCYYQSAILCNPFYDSNPVTCSLTYSSFTDNHAISGNCIRFDIVNAKYEIKSCNILRNTQGDLGSQGILRLNGNHIIENSCILENKANYIFYIESSSYTVTLSKCTVDKTTTSTGSLIIQNTVTKIFVLALTHMSTRNCYAGYDAVGALTPITPLLSSSNKQKLYYTCERLLNRCHQGNFVSLTSILVFNFINPCAPGHSLY